MLFLCCKQLSQPKPEFYFNKNVEIIIDSRKRKLLILIEWLVASLIPKVYKNCLAFIKFFF